VATRIIAYPEVLRRYEKDKFKSDVTARLNQKLSIIYEEVERIFVQFYDYVERAEKAIAPITDKYEAIQNNAQQLSTQMDRLS
jgi:hypothetical protein